MQIIFDKFKFLPMLFKENTRIGLAGVLKWNEMNFKSIVFVVAVVVVVVEKHADLLISIFDTILALVFRNCIFIQ